ncbi:hypothetical protein FEM48_Zijuj02G0001900 [Ziziphus jujuba var. spinosa]|uniref:Uncharacterized protein n=1 Tax=Ziziphus jujuba var. spinosa TaxID=714518 RepID=A0A978VSG5_ZIZJJ|nr:hypothetical protein FEM48_Zijuj02G0001900 [Ziziphus jujuba var. spinosa]
MIYMASRNRLRASRSPKKASKLGGVACPHPSIPKPSPQIHPRSAEQLILAHGTLQHNIAYPQQPALAISAFGIANAFALCLFQTLLIFIQLLLGLMTMFWLFLSKPILPPHSSSQGRS